MQERITIQGEYKGVSYSIETVPWKVDNRVNRVKRAIDEAGIGEENSENEEGQ